jgi:hypothetical protein
MKDKDFLAEADKSKLDVNPVSGEEVVIPAKLAIASASRNPGIPKSYGFRFRENDDQGGLG